MPKIVYQVTAYMYMHMAHIWNKETIVEQTLTLDISEQNQCELV